MLLADTLAMGNYSGNLTISLCADAGCGSVLGRTTVSYAVTIAENPVLTGSFLPSTVAFMAVQGDEAVNYLLRLQSPGILHATHARFSDSDNVLRIAGETQIISALPGSNNIEITVSPDVSPGTYTGNLEVSFCRGAECDRMYRGVTAPERCRGPGNRRGPTI